ncbi:GNAT family N-acetyltransferase [Actinotalea solisilvae]|uniref:GNAT family N-acetyltransferase n=1 Tax=Actinotalea solisilvae TaxID=2072922 RepID=UPI0018F1D0F0|nr:GNAT family N-acetyltransferase [Actinotalea solisilvae]
MENTGAAPDLPSDGEVEVPVQVRRDGSRYVATLRGEEVGASYVREHGDRVTFTHTEVDPDAEGHGIGSTLVRWALDDVRSRGASVDPQCPFVAAYIRRHPEYQDLVA